MAKRDREEEEEEKERCRLCLGLGGEERAPRIISPPRAKGAVVERGVSRVIN